MGFLAVAIAYLIGSIPTAYIVTRFKTGEDIRTIGGGNVGANNVYREVGHAWGIGVGVFDVLKGAGAVFITLLMLFGHYEIGIGMRYAFVFGAGVAVVAGHIWPVFLKFRGGNGLATTIGVVFIVMPNEALMALAVAILIVVLTNNPILAANLSLLLVVPVSAIFFGKTWIYFVFIGILLVMLVLNFLPTLRKAWVERGREGMMNDLMRIEKPEKVKKKKRKKYRN